MFTINFNTFSFLLKNRVSRIISRIYISILKTLSQIVPEEVALERMSESRLRHGRLPKDVGTSANVVQR